MIDNKLRKKGIVWEPAVKKEVFDSWVILRRKNGGGSMRKSKILIYLNGWIVSDRGMSQWSEGKGIYFLSKNPAKKGSALSG
ncbi:MAG: hypothetical protein HFG76_01335 [Hungatella sp.]|nr:hypothetical protein [Hungatella sp.]